MSFSKRVDELLRAPAKKEALSQLKRQVFRYARFKELLSRMEECMELSDGESEPRCMLLTGHPGVGKTMAIKTFEQAYPHTDLGDITQIPVLTALIPEPARIGGILSSMLRSMGAPSPNRGTVATKMEVFTTLIQTCGVRLIILDEFQHLIENGTTAKLSRVANWVKTLINDTKIPVILCGTPSAQEVLSGNDQLHRRFRVRYQLRSFEWGEDRVEFLNLLSMLDQVLPFSHSSNLAGDDMARRLWLASRGNMSNLMHLVQEVTLNALLLGAARLDRAAFAGYLHTEQGEMSNPFSVSEKAVQHALAKEYA